MPNAEPSRPSILLIAGDVSGDVRAEGIYSLQVGAVEGEVAVRNLGPGELNIQDVEGDVTVENVGGPVILGNL